MLSKSLTTKIQKVTFFRYVIIFVYINLKNRSNIDAVFYQTVKNLKLT